MSTNKIAPLAPHQSPASERAAPGKTGGEGGPVAGGGGEGGGGASKSGAKPAVKVDTESRKFFDTTRFTSRVASTATNVSKMRASLRDRGTVFMVLIISGVCLALLMLGIFMVYIGDEKYIVDVIVLGALCIVMGITSLVLGMVLVLRPLYRQRKEMEAEEQLRQLAKDRPGSSSVPRRPSHRLDSSSSQQPEPMPSTSEQPPLFSTSASKESPVRATLDQRSDPPGFSSRSPRGKLRTPSSPVEGPRAGRSSSASSVFSDATDDRNDTGGMVVGRVDTTRSLDDDIRALL